MLRFIFSNKEHEPCPSCEVLKEQIEIKNQETALLLEQIVRLTTPKVEVRQEIQMPKPFINKANRSWRQMEVDLREKEREEEKIKSAMRIETEKLEKELELKEEENASKISEAV